VWLLMCQKASCTCSGFNKSVSHKAGFLVPVSAVFIYRDGFNAYSMFMCKVLPEAAVHGKYGGHAGRDRWG
jgi:hypothetical protein